MSRIFAVGKNKKFSSIQEALDNHCGICDLTILISENTVLTPVHHISDNKHLNLKIVGEGTYDTCPLICASPITSAIKLEGRFTSVSISNIRIEGLNQINKASGIEIQPSYCFPSCIAIDSCRIEGPSVGIHIVGNSLQSTPQNIHITNNHILNSKSSHSRGISIDLCRRVFCKNNLIERIGIDGGIDSAGILCGPDVETLCCIENMIHRIWGYCIKTTAISNEISTNILDVGYSGGILIESSTSNIINKTVITRFGNLPSFPKTKGTPPGGAAAVRCRLCEVALRNIQTLQSSTGKINPPEASFVFDHSNILQIINDMERNVFKCHNGKDRISIVARDENDPEWRDCTSQAKASKEIILKNISDNDLLEYFIRQIDILLATKCKIKNINKFLKVLLTRIYKS